MITESRKNIQWLIEHLGRHSEIQDILRKFSEDFNSCDIQVQPFVDHLGEYFLIYVDSDCLSDRSEDLRYYDTIIKDLVRENVPWVRIVY